MTKLAPAPLVGAVGVPLITPAELSVSPAGRAPDFRLHVSVPIAPVAVRVCEYGTLTVPSGKVVGEMVKAGTIVMLRARDAVAGTGDESVSVTTKFELPVCVGVPEMVPEA